MRLLGLESIFEVRSGFRQDWKMVYRDFGLLIAIGGAMTANPVVAGVGITASVLSSAGITTSVVDGVALAAEWTIGASSEWTSFVTKR